MMKLAIAGIAVVVWAAGQEPAAGGEAGPTREPAGVVRGGNAMAFDLYGKLAAGPKGNLFLSPSSIHTALAMTYAGAGGPTAAQMAATLHLPEGGEKLHAAFGDLVRRLNDARKTDGQPAYQLHVANALWAQKGFPFRDEFMKLVQAHYQAGLTELDFRGRPEPSRAQINDRIAEQTRQKIKDLIPQGAITPLTRLVLTNAIYFKSNWAEKFEKRATRDEPFHLLGGASVKAPLMRQDEHLAYMETPAFQAVELPYLLGDLSMIVLLPRQANGLAAMEKSLTAEAVEGWRKEMTRQYVRVFLPRFKYTSQFSLPEVLKAMGMTDAFDAAKADFSGMTTADRLFISDVIHKAFVAVDEEGTEAAAATAVVMALTAMPVTPPQPKVFRADRPFIFLIRHNATGAILFLGRVTDPTRS